MKARVVVLGYVVRGPIGGLSWHHVHYVDALVRMGFDAYFVEYSGDGASCYDPTVDAMTSDPSFGLAYTGRLFADLGLHERWAFFAADRSEWCGPAGPRARELIASADVVLNLSAVNPLHHGAENVPRRVLVDTDPVFTQIRHLQDSSALSAARQHTHFFTYGEGFGGVDSAIPPDGLPWQPTRQPVVLDRWPHGPGDPSASFTTVMQWDSYASRSFDGRRYGMKSDAFTGFAGLPSLVDESFELALGAHSDVADTLRSYGWRVVNPLVVADSAWSYQDYIRRSKGEFSVAKHGYVASQSGWFSERSANYLASGRPVVVQDTGFSRYLPTGCGLHSFSDLDSAVAALERVASSYSAECRAAREVAEAYFDPERVLLPLISGEVAPSASASNGGRGGKSA